MQLTEAISCDYSVYKMIPNDHKSNVIKLLS